DLLTRTYRPAEKATVQALNDILIFSAVSTSAFFSGKLEAAFGFPLVNLGVLPVLVVVLIAILAVPRKRLA
ncbi:MAG: MFS transporter, partial [Spirochaetia bacterium]|nr:MFS transporter [Spirochaetia bacterium]